MESLSRKRIAHVLRPTRREAVASGASRLPQQLAYILVFPLLLSARDWVKHGLAGFGVVQFSIAYVALGCSILLLLGGLFLMRSRYAGAALSSGQRAMIVGGFFGMLALLTLALVWWNGL